MARSEKEYDRRKVIRSLSAMGFKRTGSAAQSRHTIFERQDGASVSLPIEGSGNSSLPMAYLYAAGLELERKGIMGRREFMARMKGNL